MNLDKAAARFHAGYRVDEATGCWLWTRGKGSKGYGMFSAPPIRLAHRFSYFLHNGELPAGMQVCHRCDVPACVNPAHLFLGTAADNQRDCRAKARAFKNAGGRVARRGVFMHRGKFQAALMVDQRSVYIGTFATADEAAHAYNKAAILHYGSGAILNPVGEPTDTNGEPRVCGEKPRRTHCDQGHPYRVNDHGELICRTCQNIWRNARRAAAKARGVRRGNT